MENVTITFIGAGNMGQALIGGLIQSSTPVDRIRAADPDAGKRTALADEFGIATFGDNAEAATGTDVLVMAVKPQVIDRVLASLSGAVGAGTLVVSVAAGIPLDRLSRGLGGHDRTVRAMPNTPALYRAGITGLTAGSGVTAEDRARAEAVMKAAGQVVWIDDESLMDAVTAVSGSGPAYFFALTEQLAAAGARAGLPPEIAEQLARQTAVGAGVMLAQSDTDAAELRRRVTSPGGTTAAALKSLEEDGFARLIEKAVDAAVVRGRALGDD